MIIKETQSNKAFRHIPVSERIEAFHADEMRKIWISDPSRNWEIFSKKVMEVSF